MNYPATRILEYDWRADQSLLKEGCYMGPIVGFTGDKPAVFFIPPGASEWPKWERSSRHVVSPPHTFRECSDGSLEIRESLGCVHAHPQEQADKGYIWHGYLDEGNVWREC